MSFIKSRTPENVMTSSRLLLIGGLVAVIAVVGLVLADTSGSTTVSTPYEPQPPSDPQGLTAQTIRTYDAFDADQGVAVDRRYFYSIDNYSITKHDRATGKPLLQWYGGEETHELTHRGERRAAREVPEGRRLAPLTTSPSRTRS